MNKNYIRIFVEDIILKTYGYDNISNYISDIRNVGSAVRAAVCCVSKAQGGCIFYRGIKCKEIYDDPKDCQLGVGDFGFDNIAFSINYA